MGVLRWSTPKYLSHINYLCTNDLPDRCLHRIHFLHPTNRIIPFEHFRNSAFRYEALCELLRHLRGALVNSCKVVIQFPRRQQCYVGTMPILPEKRLMPYPPDSVYNGPIISDHSSKNYREHGKIQQESEKETTP